MSDLILTIDTDKLYLEELTVSFDSPISFTGDNVTVNWGDGTTPTIYTSGTLSHTYTTGGEYEITITGNVTGINDYAFQQITEIVIPSSVTFIGSYVFGNEIIEVVTFEGTTPPTFGAGVLYLDAEYGFTIRVPTGSLTTYQQSEYFPTVEWENYELYTIEEYTPQSSSQEETPIGNLYNHLKTLIKQWVYDKTEINEGFVAKSNTDGLLKNDGTVDTSIYLTQHQDITGKLDIAQTSYKGKNVVVDSTTGNITFENKPSIPSDVSDLTDTHNTQFTPKTHNHDDRYNTKEEIEDITSEFAGTDVYDIKADIEHTHSKSEITDFTHTHTLSDITDYSNDKYKISIRPGDSIIYGEVFKNGALDTTGEFTLKVIVIGIDLLLGMMWNGVEQNYYLMVSKEMQGKLAVAYCEELCQYSNPLYIGDGYDTPL